jgi:hypothetical protein
MYIKTTLKYIKFENKENIPEVIERVIEVGEII